ncbi:glycosyltransferase family 4 protein [Vibrio parahaemolyticus]|uniref:glycosyltransferase family 4 protein n=1 Tax=Vibrio parahaemolyticus TaxID=670 RepID=UPI0027E56D13|nr:glycosyltransferase family 4 protein [Vibrio parahaemolyticus]WMN63446.1 glycosyltransferase family 4 protein [Vibrio parahaemolyticus]WMN74082.1 glycosyltransferase family 4 protein [Vibrio parahaemolyticus]
MKFLIFTSELKFSGPNNVILSLVSGLNKLGVETIVCGLRERRDVSYCDKLSLLGARVEWINNHESLLPFMLNKIKHHKPDSVNSHGIRSDVALFALRRFLNIKIISTIHNVPYEDYASRYSSFVAKTMLFLHSKVFKSVHIAKVAVSNNVKTCLVSKGAKNISAVYNGVIGDSFYNSNEQREIVETKLGLSHGKKRFVFCGHLTEIKQPLLIKEVSRFFPDYEFVILGDGPLMDTMKNVDIQHDNLIIKGRVINVSDYMAVSDYFIMPSLTEGMPMAFIEALFSNLHPICSNIPIFKELKNIPNISMSIFDVGNVDSLKREIEALDFSLVNKNQEVAERYFSDLAMSNEYIKVAESE